LERITDNTTSGMAMASTTLRAAYNDASTCPNSAAST
jgi:hypothetical protein